MAELPDRLREAAQAHHPDRERMLARVDRAMAAAPARGRHGAGWWQRPAAPWMRVAAVAAAVAGAVGLGGLATGAVTGQSEPGRGTVTSSAGAGAATPAPAGEGTPGAATSRPGVPPADSELEGRPASAVPAPGRSGAAPSSPSLSPVTTPPVAGTAAPGTAPPPVRNSGVSCSATVSVNSNPYWMQSDLKVTTDRPLTSLAVELRVARTAGAVSTGSFTTASGDTTASITTEDDAIVYRWTLNPDRTLGPGTYTFAGQFNHDKGDRDTSGDHYRVAADGPGGPANVGGGF